MRARRVFFKQKIREESRKSTTVATRWQLDTRRIVPTTVHAALLLFGWPERAVTSPSLPARGMPDVIRAYVHTHTARAATRRAKERKRDREKEKKVKRKKKENEEAGETVG